MKTLEIDIETFSSLSLQKCGVYKYAEAPDFQIILLGYSLDGGEVKVTDLLQGETIPQDILNALTDDNVIKWAHNCNFERVCLSRHLSDLGVSLDPFHDKHPLSTECARFLNPSSWRCSMTWAAYLGLPLSLAGVGEILGLEKKKLTEGKELIKYFCQPCAPTKANGERTRNMPADSPDKWELFKSYNLRDVEVEMQIQRKFSKFSVPDFVWDEYALDQEINDRGIGVDMRFVSACLSLEAKSTYKLTEAMRELTALENPNSVAQVKGWLADNGLKIDTLGKNEVSAQLKTAPAELVPVLQLRQQLAKSSVKKYTAMENAVCSDNRVRGMFMFYGASRTGRFAGRLVQLQNLPQNHIPDLAEARALAGAEDFDALEMLYEDIPDTLSQLIRTAFVPQNGRKFIVADFSAIEARVISWFAGEKWKSDAFAKGEDIYCATASQMFHVPVVKHGANSELRQKGKIAELACIAEGQLVLTNYGLTRIENVTTDMKLWDGMNWVNHDGVIYKGEREVITYEGLTATPDHLVWVEGQSEPIRFGFAASCGARLLQTGYGGNPIRLGKDYQFPEKMERKAKSLLCADPMSRLRCHSMAAARKPDKWKIKGLPSLLSAETNTTVARSTADGSKAEVRESEGCQLSQLWVKRYPFRLSKRNRSRFVSHKRIRLTRARNGNRQNRQQRKLCSRKYSFCNSYAKQQQQAEYGTISFFTRVLAICEKRCDKKIVTRINSKRDNPGCGDSSFREKKELETNKRTARLYDIRNAGPHHRFTVSGKLVHNCGYGGSVGALKAMGALDMGLKEQELQPIVNSWRSANPNIVKFWWAVDHAAKTAVRGKTTASTNGVSFSCESGFLFITLPSGRRLAYVKPRIGENRFGGEGITYEGTGSTKKWERLETYGPKLVENIVQAAARDILCYSMQTLRNCSIIIHCHDELVIEADKHMGSGAVCEQMGQTPPWAKGLLLRADGYETEFYRKD